MNLKLENYLVQKENWPNEGKHILAQYTDDYVIVYQAYRPEIGLLASTNKYFGGEFSYSRMSWIKPNFLWMMYRSGWGTKVGQEITLAIYLKRDYFNQILRNAFPSTNLYGIPKDEWDRKISRTDVRLQWDPDHDPFGKPQARKAIQLGLRKDYLIPFKGEGIIDIEDISDFVFQQKNIIEQGGVSELTIPKEEIFKVDSEISSSLFM